MLSDRKNSLLAEGSGHALGQIKKRSPCGGAKSTFHAEIIKTILRKEE